MQNVKEINYPFLQFETSIYLEFRIGKWHQFVFVLFYGIEIFITLKTFEAENSITGGNDYYDIPDPEEDGGVRGGDRPPVNYLRLNIRIMD